MSEWEIRLPWTTPPLSLNDRSHWRAKASKTATVRALTKTVVSLCYVATSDTIPTKWPLSRAAITLTYYPRDRRRRDRTNLVATYKACVDGCVDAGVIPDDTPQWLEELMPVIAEPDGDPRLVLTIRELP